jgi:hypothetical protein
MSNIQLRVEKNNEHTIIHKNTIEKLKLEFFGFLSFLGYFNGGFAILHNVNFLIVPAYYSGSLIM